MRTLTLIAALLVGCPGPTEETAVTPDEPAEISWMELGSPAVDAPRIPWLADGVPPVALPDSTCPDGWAFERLDLDGLGACEPYPDGLLDCAPTAHQPPGAAACQDVGYACPLEGDWPRPDPSGRMLYVRPGAVGGDGSQEAPFGTIAEAIAASPTGGFGADPMPILLSAGTHEVSTVVDRPVALRGACAERTQLTASTCDDKAMLVANDDLSVSGLSFVGPGCGGIRNAAGTVTVDGVAMLGLDGPALYFAEAGSVSDVVIRDTQPGARQLGTGIRAESRSQVQLHRVSVLGSVAESVSATYASTIEATDLLVAGQVATDRGEVFPAMGAGIQAELDLERAVIQDVAGWGVSCTNGAKADVRDTVVRRITRSETRSGGIGMAAGTDSALTLERVRIEATVEAGLIATTASVITGTDIVLSLNDYRGGVVYEGGRLALTRVVGFQNGYSDFSLNSDGVVVVHDGTFRGDAVVASSFGGALELRRLDHVGDGLLVDQSGGGRVVVMDVASASPYGMWANSYSAPVPLELERVVLAGGVSVSGWWNELIATDVVLGSDSTATDGALTRVAVDGRLTTLGTVTGTDLRVGGLDVDQGDATLRSVVVENGAGTGLRVALPATAVVEDLAVIGTRECAECGPAADIAVDGLLTGERVLADGDVPVALRVNLGLAALTDAVLNGAVDVGFDGELDATRVDSPE